MSAQDSISGFFYNLIPGILCVLGALWLIDGFPCLLFLFRYNEGLAILLTVVFGLFIGFVFQAIAKIPWIREMFELSSRQDVLIDNEHIYPKAVTELSKVIPAGEFTNIKTDKKKQKKFFYLMYNYLRGTGHAETIMFFTERASLWSNLFFGSLVFLIFYDGFTIWQFFHGGLFALFLNANKFIWLFMIIVGLTFFSRTTLIEYLRIFNETTLLTYVTLIKHSKKFDNLNYRTKKRRAK